MNNLLNLFIALKYLAFQTPYPKDGENLIGKIDQAEKEENTRLVEFLKQVAKNIEVLKAEVCKTIIFSIKSSKKLKISGLIS